MPVLDRSKQITAKARAEAEAKAAKETEAKRYLAETDFYALRELEGGKPMPADIKAKRAQARASLN